MIAPRLPGPALTRVATAICLLGTAASVVLLALALYRFRFGLSHGALWWYVISVSGIVITLLLVRSSATTRVMASVIGVIVVATLLGLELGLEFIERSKFVRMQEAVERQTGVPFDRRSIRQVVGDLRLQGTPAVASVVPKVILPYTDGQTSPESEFRAAFLPLAGVSRRPTVQLCAEGGRYPIYQSDEYGFLNPPGTWTRSPNLVTLIGDSFTHGYCVPSDSNVAAYLRLTWPHVLSLGTGGSGSLAELATLTEYAAPMAPRLVLWMYSENDLADLALEQKNVTLRSYMEKGFCQGLRLRQTEIDSMVSGWVDRLYAARAEPPLWGTYGWRRTVVLAALRTLLFAGNSGRAANPLDQLPMFKGTLREANERVSAWGGRMVFVFLPAWERLFDAEIARDDLTRPAVLDAARGLDMQIVDLTPVFSAHANPAALYSRGSSSPGHYSAQGYSLVARTIASAVSPPATSVQRAPVDTHIALGPDRNACGTVVGKR